MGKSVWFERWKTIKKDAKRKMCKMQEDISWKVVGSNRNQFQDFYIFKCLLLGAYVIEEARS